MSKRRPTKPSFPSQAKRYWFVFLGLAACAAPACADRDIVYAARYYSPPEDHRTSHFHLYRINPDGTGRTQITFGGTDDDHPRWSPDGREILFIRHRRGGDLCVLRLKSRAIRRVFTFKPDTGLGSDSWFEWLPIQWSPDGKMVAMSRQIPTSGDSGTPPYWELHLVDVRTCRVRVFPNARSVSWSPDGRKAILCYGDRRMIGDGDLHSIRRISGTSNLPGGRFSDVLLWLNADTLLDDAGPATDTVDNPDVLRLQTAQGRELAQIRLHDPDTSGGANGFIRLPKNHPSVVYVEEAFNSTQGDVYHFSVADLESGQLRPLTDGSTFALSGDRKRFCAAPGRDTSYYSHWADGRERSVWTAPLQVGSIQTGHTRKITRGMVYVTGADWRRGTR